MLLLKYKKNFKVAGGSFKKKLVKFRTKKLKSSVAYRHRLKKKYCYHHLYKIFYDFAANVFFIKFTAKKVLATRLILLKNFCTLLKSNIF